MRAAGPQGGAMVALWPLGAYALYAVGTGSVTWLRMAIARDLHPDAPGAGGFGACGISPALGRTTQPCWPSRCPYGSAGCTAVSPTRNFASPTSCRCCWGSTWAWRRLSSCGGWTASATRSAGGWSGSSLARLCFAAVAVDRHSTGNRDSFRSLRSGRGALARAADSICWAFLYSRLGRRSFSFAGCCRIF